MKRNYPSERPDDIAEDSRIIQERLSELYPANAASDHKIAIGNKGYYIKAWHHVRLDSSVKLHNLQGFVEYCDNLNYHYLGPYQALYLLDSRQLILFFNELPLSLAEAYNLLLSDRNDAINYSVFCHLNRSAYYCLIPQVLDWPKLLIPTDSDNPRLSSCHGKLDVAKQDSQTEPLFQIDSMDSSYDELLKKLRERGPKNLESVDQGIDDGLSIVFNAYKRETFTKNKPRRGKRGHPDWYVIIRDQMKHQIPKGLQLASFSLGFGDAERRKLLFALVDADNTTSFVHFDPMCPSDLLVDHQAWPEQIRACKLTEAAHF